MFFDRLNPMGKRVKTNKDALALIVGVADYENTPAKAVFADSDARMFHDYASEKLGIPESRIKTLVNDGADESGMLLAVKRWLARASKQGKSDVYVFFFRGNFRFLVVTGQRQVDGGRLNGSPGNSVIARRFKPLALLRRRSRRTKFITRALVAPIAH